MPPLCVRCGQPAGAGIIEVKGGGSDSWGKHYEFATLHFPVCPACDAYAAASRRQRKQVAASVSYTLMDVNKKTGTHVKATFQNDIFAALFLQANADVFSATEAATAEKREKERWHKDNWIGLVGLGVFAVVASLFAEWETKARIDAPKLPVIAFMLLGLAGTCLLFLTKAKVYAVLGSAMMLVAGIGVAWQAAAGLGQYQAHTPGGLWWCAIGSWAIVIGAFAMLIVSAIWGNVYDTDEREAKEVSAGEANAPPPATSSAPSPALSTPGVPDLPPPPM
jgi:hypothetical protein